MTFLTHQEHPLPCFWDSTDSYLTKSPKSSRHLALCCFMPFYAKVDNTYGRAQATLILIRLAIATLMVAGGTGPWPPSVSVGSGSVFTPPELIRQQAAADLPSLINNLPSLPSPTTLLHLFFVSCSFHFLASQSFLFPVSYSCLSPITSSLGRPTQPRVISPPPTTAAMTPKSNRSLYGELCSSGSPASSGWLSSLPYVESSSKAHSTQHC